MKEITRKTKKKIQDIFEVVNSETKLQNLSIWCWVRDTKLQQHEDKKKLG